MNKKINFQDKQVSYTLKTSKRAKRMRLAIYCDGSFVVTRPRGLSEEKIEKFILEKSSWIVSKLDYFKNFKIKPTPLINNKNNYSKHKSAAREFIEERIKYYNQFYNLKFNRINVKRQKTRWGSCSKKGNLNFNYKILFLPRHIADYIIVHELCHLKEFSHSYKFWNLVADRAPDYKKIRKELRKNGLNII
jgi:predicted metal-dependent hydrolase